MQTADLLICDSLTRHVALTFPQPIKKKVVKKPVKKVVKKPVKKIVRKPIKKSGARKSNTVESIFGAVIPTVQGFGTTNVLSPNVVVGVTLWLLVLARYVLFYGFFGGE